MTVYVYMLLCGNKTVYTGITKNLEQRIKQHASGKGGSRYTKEHGVIGVLGYFGYENRSIAMKEEYRIKRELTSHRKRLLAVSWKSDDTEIKKLNKILTR